MSSTNDRSKKPYSLHRLGRIAVAAVLTLCACLALIAFANRDNPSNAPTLKVQDLATAATSLAPSPTPHGGESVALSLNTGIIGTLLNIQGTTNLPNRAVLLYRVSQVAPDPIAIDGTVAVLDGRYAAQVDISGLPPGAIEVWIAFQPVFGNNEKQPPEILERYGEMGEYLYGENVMESSGMKRVEVRQTLEIFP